VSVVVEPAWARREVSVTGERGEESLGNLAGPFFVGEESGVGDDVESCIGTVGDHGPRPVDGEELVLCAPRQRDRYLDAAVERMKVVDE
jgi:hypothetical protein